jgi:putative Holliday junction resolvase
MPRILAIDYGNKRVGIAVTDNLQMIATPLTTVHSKDVIEYLRKYIIAEEVIRFVVGEPRQLDGKPSESGKFVDAFVRQLQKHFPQIPVSRIDERYTSSIARQALVQGGFKKKDREDKNLLDSMAAALILQTYLAINNP